MEDSLCFMATLSLSSLYIASAATALCILCVFWTYRSSSTSSLQNFRLHKSEGRVRKRSGGIGLGSSSHVYANGGAGVKCERELMVAAVKGLDKQTGGSMMEQLVPEIRTHALSYLDYPSLCRLSMTNSWMRKAANDDNAWKALYHKDFTIEQVNITPYNGWKAYYAATKAIMKINASFYSIIKERSIRAMGCLWLQADYVKCIHGSGELFSGYNAVMGSWELAFNWGQEINFQIRDVRARVLPDVAWVNMKAYVNVDAGPFLMTNIFEFHKGQWCMVHHHSSIFADGEGEHPNMLG